MKIFLVFFILLSSFSNGYSQAYTPFPETNAVWTEYFNGCQNQDFFTENYTQVYFNGDTLIKGLIYHKLAGQELNGSGSCDIYPYYGSISYIDTIPFLRFGYLRQDAVLRRVYYLKDDTSTETILYDFNLSVGDTITQLFRNTNCQYDTVIVKSIDTLYLDRPYRQYNFDVTTNFGPQYYHEYTSWIEGIGSRQGVLYGLNYCGNQLRCFSRSDSTIYPQFSPTACAILTGVSEVPQQISSFHIYPNPASNICTLKWNDMPGNYTASVFDLTGREVMLLFVQKHISTFNFNVDRLPAGLYFVKLNDDAGHFAVSKLVKE